MTNIVVLCHDRYKLTVQCIESIRKNTGPGTYNLTLVDDYSSDFRVRNYLHELTIYNPRNTTLIRVYNSRHCLGALKNLGVMHSELMFGHEQWLCVLDSDVYLMPGWLDAMTMALQTPSLAIVGGIRHPFHAVNKTLENGVECTDAVAGYCHFMTWSDWIALGGHYVADAPGIGRSEDFELCQRAVKRGAKVGYINPPVMAHCGITNSNGELIAGADQTVYVPGVLYL